MPPRTGSLLLTPGLGECGDLACRPRWPWSWPDGLAAASALRTTPLLLPVVHSVVTPSVATSHLGALVRLR
eukprot:9499605-Pyramimonas_sp.AAC.1